MATNIDRLVPARRVYPWDKWTNGQPWRAKQARDFDCTPEGFRATLYSHADRKGLSVSVTIQEKQRAVDFQFTK